MAKAREKEADQVPGMFILNFTEVGFSSSFLKEILLFTSQSEICIFFTLYFIRKENRNDHDGILSRKSSDPKSDALFIRHIGMKTLQYK